MALVKGTNIGFVTTAPTTDPDGNFTSTIDNRRRANGDTTPTGTIKVIEMGWYTPNATSDVNFDIGIYNDNSGPDQRIFVSQGNAKGSDAGWKVVTGLNWVISAETLYWLGVQLDSGDSTNIDRQSGGTGYYFVTGATELPDPWDSTDFSSGSDLAIYAVYETGAAGVTRKIKIAGTFVDKPIKTKVAGVFVDKPIKIKVGGTFVDA